MKHRLTYLSVVFLLFSLSSFSLYGQQSYYDSLLTERVKVENPEYKPVVGIGMGSFAFLGDVQNNYWHLFPNNPGLRITVSSFLDKRHLTRLDFIILNGSLSGNQVGSSGDHLNFRTDITSFGASVSFDFSSLYRKPSMVSPYVSLGLETFFFNSKSDMKGPDGQYYIYDEDGTVRNRAGRIIARDHVYETDLRSLDLYGRGNYPEYGFGVPVELGVEAFFSRRVSMRVGTSIHLTSTDLIDNVDKHSTGVSVNRVNDFFTFTFITLNLDLFSDPEYRKVKKMFRDIPDDDVISGDADKDWVLDFIDKCPNTPPGVVVDSTGCPVDSDHDGIPDYLDEEKETPLGLRVDETGKGVNDSLGINRIEHEEGAELADFGHYLQTRGGRETYSAGQKKIPAQFRAFDLDRDGEISFDELVKVIEKYFDYRTFLSLQDIYELMDFYFSQ